MLRRRRFGWSCIHLRRPFVLAAEVSVMPSLWRAETKPQVFPPLEQDASCDLAVVGSGIAGLSSAYEAARCGAKVIVIDRRDITDGMTARTTAHLVSEIDDRYSDLIGLVGEDDARLYHESQVAAINRIETVCQDEGITADFARLPGYLVPAEPAHMEELQREYDACRTLEVEVEWAESVPYALAAGLKALKFANQGRFHPLKYCAGLVQAIQQRGGRIHGRTAYVGHEEENGSVVITTERGATLRAGAALFATNSPVNDRVAIHTKQEPMRTYAMAARIPRGSVEDALIWDTLWPYHYVRLQPAGESQDWLIVGGEDHRTGTANDMNERFARLENWTRERFPGFTGAEHRWSGQVMEPVDSLPYSGRDGSDRIYVHTGDSGTGMTNAVAGALNFIALYRNDKARFAELFDPGRKPKARLSLGEYVKGQGPVVANLAEYVGAGEVDSVEAIAPGEGAILRRGLAKHAVYRADDGSVTEVSATCTHAGCIVHWNSFEKCWDCPCHGSQFQPDGTVLNAPAIKPLAQVDEVPDAEANLEEPHPAM
jgi:glycine/D-amino acid oxidase-like deaminating enzyme/nitrite reductase/ring-hydroxylating ferredoxin subunit